MSENDAALPKTWGDYFIMRRANSEAESDARLRFRGASDDLQTISRRLEALEAWAEAAEKKRPYTGQHMRDEPIASDS